MLIGPRPTLGWLVYLMVKGSWYRMAVILCIFGFATLTILHQGSRTLTLQYSKPMPFPPPMMFLPPPSHGYMTALDACSVEAAAIRVDNLESSSLHGDKYDERVRDAAKSEEEGGKSKKEGGKSKKEGGKSMKEGKKSKKEGGMGHIGRQVYVYLWQTSVGPKDVWGQWVTRLPGVRLDLLEVPKIVTRTPVKKLAKLRSWSSYPNWSVWAAARVALLWAAGGMVVPLGVVMTRPVWVEAAGLGSGILVTGQGGTMDPVVLSSPAHHPLLSALTTYLVNGTNNNFDQITSQSELLTKAVKEACGVKNVARLAVGNCSDFTILPRSFIVDMDLTQTPQAVGSESAFLRYINEDYFLEDPVIAYQLFQNYHLSQYCPKTANQLEVMFRQHL
ncbi:hypothetical protein Hamer_G004804 [Homarus americanus]|uniref:Uncharacterized protein n=1 Tax=Homarus americanus TaxID=6706 RepID=A0A8J5JWA4_HOMAM|nr:hypothetical protein Hamer_G004804 [Homarus americanus]